MGAGELSLGGDAWKQDELYPVCKRCDSNIAFLISLFSTCGLESLHINNGESPNQSLRLECFRFHLLQFTFQCTHIEPGNRDPS